LFVFGQFVCHLGSAAAPANTTMTGEVKTSTGENDDWDVGDGKNYIGHVFLPQQDSSQPRSSRAAAQRFPPLAPTERCPRILWAILGHPTI
jgi:hypothetical protein